MKFLVSKNLHTNPNFTLLLSFYALMMLLYFIGDIFYLINFFGPTPCEVISTIKGKAEDFIEPLSLLSLLEHLHISLFLAILALFTTMAILLRLSLSFTHKKWIILLAMGSALLSFMALLGLYFSSKWMVYPFILFSLMWHLVGIYALSIALYQLGFKKT